MDKDTKGMLEFLIRQLRSNAACATRLMESKVTQIEHYHRGIRDGYVHAAELLETLIHEHD